MGHFQDHLRRKLTDNLISLTGQASDCIRVKYKRTRNGDIETRVVEGADVVSVIFPVLKDVPYRRLAKSIDGTSSTISIETLPTAMELFPMQIMVPHNNNIYRDDLIFRLFRDVTEVEYAPDYLLSTKNDMMDGSSNPNVRPIILVLQVKEPLGTFGAESLVWTKFNCTYSDE